METVSQKSVSDKVSSIFTPKRIFALFNFAILFTILISEEGLKIISENLYYFVLWVFMYGFTSYFKPKDRFDKYILWPVSYPILIWAAYYMLLSNQLFDEYPLPKLAGMLTGFFYTLVFYAYFIKNEKKLN
ncbi:MAG: hypothetical protein ACXIUD_08105 [Mongoliitalea sp.]